MESDVVYKEISLGVILSSIIRRFVLIVLCSIFGFIIASCFLNLKTRKEMDQYITQVESYEKEVELYKYKINNLKSIRENIDTNYTNYSLRDLIDLDNTIIGLETNLESLQKPERPSTSFLNKKTILGFVAGGFVAIVYLIISFLFSNPVVLSYDAENRLKTPFFGALFYSNNLLNKFARRIICERSYPDELIAKEMIQSNLSVLSNKKKNAKVAFISSIGDKAVKKTSELVSEIASSSGLTSVFVLSATQNPEAIKCVSDSDFVIIIEEQWKSKWIQIASTVDFVERQEKKICGLILC